MADFDFDAYLGKRLDNVDIEAKMDRLRFKGERVNESLVAAKEKIDANKNSWAARAGFSQEDFLGARVNDAASLVSGASRLGGHVVSLFPNAMAAISTLGATDTDYRAAEHAQAEKAGYGQATSKEKRIAQKFQSAEASREQGRAVNKTFDLSEIVDKTNRDALDAELSAGFTAPWEEVKKGNVASGLADLFMNAGSAVLSNPAAAREYILENIPQLLVGGVGKVGQGVMAASNIGYAADEYSKGLANYALYNSGQLPPEEKRREMAMMAASIALAEQVGDKALLGMGKVSKALRGETDDALATSFKQSLLNTGKAAAGGVITEAATEGYQTFAEGAVRGQPASAEDIYKGAVIGGVAGGGMAGGARAVAETFGVTPEQVEARVAAEAKEVADTKAVEKAVEEANPDVFLDRTSKNYSPAKAIGVMMSLAEKEGTTPEEFNKQLSKATEVIEKLEFQRSSLDPKVVEENLNDIKQEIANTDPADVDTIADLNDELEGVTQQLADMRDPKKAVNYQNKLKTIQSQLKEAEAVHAGFSRLAAPAPSVTEVKDAVTQADSSDIVTSRKAGDTLINLSMTAPDDLTPENALKLATNSKNGLTKDQRTFLRQFAEARVAENELKKLSDVSREVFYGSERYVGISQYRTRVASALAAKNEDRANRQLASLSTFMKDHTAKLEIAETAPAKSQIIKVGKGWEVNTGKRLSDKDLKKNGGFNLNSEKLVDGIRKEVQALTMAHTQLSSAVALRFKKAPVKSVAPTPAAPKSTASPSVSPASLFREKRERGEHLKSDKSDSREKTPESVVEKPQVEEKVQTISEPVVAPASPTATQPVVADATPVAASAPAEEVGLDEMEAMWAESDDTDVAPVVTNSTNSTNSVATEQPAVAPAKAQAAEVATPDEQKPTGRLSILATKLKEIPAKMQELYSNTSFNPIAQFLSQKTTNEEYATHRPLVDMKDFFSHYLKGKVDSSRYLKKAPSDEQNMALEHFDKQVIKWNKLLEANLREYSTDPKKKDFRFEDMMPFLLTKDGDKVTTDENVLTAMSYAAYSKALDIANSPHSKKKEQLSSMFGFDEETTVIAEGVAALRNVTDHEATFINDVGQLALSALGFQASPNAPKDILPKLKLAMGTHIMALMEHKDVGLIQRKPMVRELVLSYFNKASEPTWKVKDILEEEQSRREKGEKVKPRFNQTMSFVFPNRDAIKEMQEVNWGTDGVVDQLFGADKAPRMAAKEPVPFKQKFAKQTKQLVPESQAKAINDVQNTPHTVVSDMWDAAKGIGRDALLRIAGFVDVENDIIHLENVESALAQNDNLTNQLDLMLEMMGVRDFDESVDKLQAYYVRGEVWKNFRAGFTTRSLNQQTSKIHRYMFARPKWTVTVNLDNPAHVIDLKIALGAGFGLKTDEKPNEVTLADFDAKIQEPKVRAAIDAMTAGLKSNDWSGSDAIADFASGAEGMMTLQTLIAMSRYEMSGGTGKLDVTLLVGADGKTNGPILSHLAFGAAESVEALLETMERGGMYGTADTDPKHFSEWRIKGMQDLYQDLASYLLRTVREYIREERELPALRAAHFNDKKTRNKPFPYFTQAAYDALQGITGKLEDAEGNVQKGGRDLVKTPLTAFSFGSSLTRSVEAMEDKFIDSIYATVEKLAQKERDANTDAKKEAAKAATDAFIRALNTLVSQSDGSAELTQEGVTAEQLLKFTLPEQDITALRNSFKTIMNAPVKGTMESYFSVFMQRRTDLNTTIQAAYNMYSAAYKAARESLIAKLVADDKMGYRTQTGGTAATGKGKRIAIHDLSEQQEDELRKQLLPLLPVAHTAYSLRGNKLEQGLYMAKDEVSLSDDPLNTAKVNLANGIINSNGVQSQHLESNAMVRTEIAPGVAGASYFIHSLDSANIHDAQNDVGQVMNVHDEAGNSVLDITATAEAINRATYVNMLNFSPVRQALNTLERIVTAMAAGVKDGTVSVGAAEAAFDAWGLDLSKRKFGRDSQNVYTAKESAEEMLELSLNNAVEADTLRLGTLAKLGTVDQYVWENGQYKVDPKLRAKAETELANLVTDLKPETKEALAYLMEALGQEDKGVKPTLETQEQPDDLPTSTPAGIAGAVLATVAGQSVTDESLRQMKPMERAKLIRTASRYSKVLAGTGWTAWGKLGFDPTLNINILSAFIQNPKMHKNEVVELLKSELKGAQLALLNTIAKSLPNNLRFEMVSSDTNTGAVVDMPHDTSRGWFVATASGTNVVYVLSNEFEHSGMNAETLLHELVHGALAREVKNPSADSKALVEELTALMEHVSKQPGADKFSAATKDVQEFLAWGLSNKEFQGFLNGIEGIESKTSQNRFVTAMQKFISVIAGLLFKDTNAAKERALYAVIQNAAGLFAASAENTLKSNMNLSQVAAPDSYTTMEIYEGLASDVKPLEEKDDLRIRALMSTMVNALSPIYGVFGPDIQSKVVSARTAFINAPAPFASDADAMGVSYNEQVAFALEQVEVTVRAAINGDTGQTSMAYRELSKLYDEAEKALKGKISDELYNFMFNLESGVDNRSDYLSRFASLGLVHPEVNAALGFNTEIKPEGTLDNTLGGRLQALFNQILQWVVGKWTKTRAGEQADTKLDTLAQQLVLIEASRRARLNVKKNKTAEAIEQAFSNAGDKVRDKVDGWANSEFFKGSNNGYVRMIGSITSTVVKDRLDQLGLAFQTFSDTHFRHSQGTMAGILDELRGTRKDNVVMRKLLRLTKFIEVRRKDLISQTSKIALESFANKGKNLTVEMKKSISAVMLRTDMASLLESYKLDGLLKIMGNKSELHKAIGAVEDKLKGNAHATYLNNAADALGYQMATGEAGSVHTTLNAYAIARLFGTDSMDKVTEEQAVKNQAIVDELASLYALTYVNGTDLKNAITVFEAENARTDKGHGVDMVLRLHGQLQTESKARLFKEQEALMMKGYVPEVYDHYMEILVADKVEASNLKEQGYGQGMKLNNDLDDTESANKMMFARRGSGLLPYLSANFSMTAAKTKGTTKHNGNMDFFSDQGQYNIDMMAEIQAKKKNAINQMFIQRVKPGSNNRNFMVPVLNPAGQVVNYRYMMKNRVKDDVLHRDNRFEQLLGSMAGSIYDKEASPKQNENIVQALKAQYDLEFKTRAVSYLEIGPNSPDPELREKYRLLPDATKMAVRAIWKTDSMFVRTDLLDITFGYRKKSLSDILQTDPEAREGMNKLLGEVLGLVGGRPVGAETEEERRVREAKATIRIRNGEEIWQTFVKEAKDMIVVKSGSTLVGNIISNFTLLTGYGVPIMDQIRSHRIALRGALDHKRDSEELFKLETEVSTGVVKNEGATKARIVKLKDKLSRNPVRQLIEAGLMPTIVEDIEVDDDIYSFKSRFTKDIERLGAKVNPNVMTVAKTLYMTHDTKLYKLLSQGTQLSDFLARYSLYQHLTTKKNPMTSDKAIQEASDAFINYDVPTHRNMQYANDMGVIRFTKYYLRIQKMIMHLYRENPARMLGLMALGNYFDALPTVLDSAAFTRLGNNPLEWGAFEYLTSFDDLVTTKLMVAPF